VHPGAGNRIDLEMVVDTPSERLSYASGYAFHNLGGIDRSIHVYALPESHIRSLHISSDLDSRYRDANLTVTMGLQAEGHTNSANLAVEPELYAPDGSRMPMEK